MTIKIGVNTHYFAEVVLSKTYRLHCECKHVLVVMNFRIKLHRETTSLIVLFRMRKKSRQCIKDITACRCAIDADVCSIVRLILCSQSSETVCCPD